MIKQQMDEDPTLNATAAEIMIKNKIGSNKMKDLTEDYIENKQNGEQTAATLHMTAQALANAIGDIQHSIENDLGIELENENTAAKKAAILKAASNNLDKAFDTILVENNATAAANKITNSTEIDNNSTAARKYIDDKVRQFQENQNAEIKTAQNELVDNVSGGIDVYGNNEVEVRVTKRTNGIEYFTTNSSLSQIDYSLDNINIVQEKNKDANYTTTENGKMIINKNFQNAIIKDVAVIDLQGTTRKIKQITDDQDLDPTSNLANTEVSFSEGAKLYKFLLLQKKPDDLSSLETANFNTLYNNQINLTTFNLDYFVDYAENNGFTFFGTDYNFNSTNNAVQTSINGTTIEAGSYQKNSTTNTLFVELPRERFDMAVRIGQDNNKDRVLSQDVILSKRANSFTNLNRDALQDVLYTLHSN